MSMTTAAPTVTLDVFEAAAEAAASLLPADMGWTGEIVDGPALPSSARAVVLELPGCGRVVLAASPSLARSVQVGPPPAEDLVEGLTPALEAFADTLSRFVGIGFAGAMPTEADAVTVLTPGVGEQVFSLKLVDGERHSATICFVTMEEPVVAPASASPALVQHEFDAIADHGAARTNAHPVTVLHEVEMGVTVELGRTRMLVRDILGLSVGSVIELDRAAGSPVDVLVNGTLIARGEVVVIDEEFGIRVTEVIGYQADAARGRR